MVWSAFSAAKGSCSDSINREKPGDPMRKEAKTGEYSVEN